MQKGQTGILILAGIVLLLAVAGGIFFLGRVTAPQIPVATFSPQPSPLSTETSVKEDDETTNWKTYTNDKYKFTLQYPPNLVISEQGVIRLTNEASMPKVIPDKYINILIFVHTSDPQISFREWIEKDTTRNKPDGTTGSIVVGAIENYRSGDLQGFTYHGGAEVDIKHVLFKKEDQIFDFTLDCYETGCGYKDSPTAESTFDQILSTFKFLP